MDFLDDIKNKIARHANILKARHLSIRGSGLVANSLLLSRLWHVLRVNPAPEPWLQEVKSIVRKYVLPFWPAPAWTTTCLPRRYGGVGLIDIQDQSLALHFIYIQRLCAPRRVSDFLSPWIIKYYQQLTGHASLLPWFLFPSKFKSHLSKDPNMAHLSKLIARLPPLPLSSAWSSRWYLDLPLQDILPQNTDLPQLSSRYLLSDIVRWHLRRRCFIFYHHRQPPALSKVVQWLHDTRTDDAYATITLPNNIIIRLYRTHFMTPDIQPAAPPQSLMPSLSHWSLAITSSTTRPVLTLSLGQVRRSWHPNWQEMLNRPQPPQLIRPFSLCYPTFVWQQFWRLPLPSKSITAWWRILHDCVAYRVKLHRWQPSRYPSTECPICQTAPETLYHMIVDCPRKRPFWLDALSTYQLLGKFPTQASIWHALVQLRFTNGTTVPIPDLIRLGCILAVLWRHHWRCVIDEDFWSSEAALNTLLSDPLYSSFIPSETI
ncbi:hypothetical protein LRAMOSA11422 [Lichtheimia ramosa]|uniref:Reverse transcriptase zinc-binding domain-containing protein n=1 Tax=Lichtheimia ramosa TaxID=688394 RepID=A0A077WTK8_9FUNG|nr:hypothetical protein LRAMOSA11422 [Lichtheimia ramosa]